MSVLSRLYTGTGAFYIVGRRKLWLTISTILVIMSAIFLVKPGLNPGIEFRGGSEFVVAGVADKDQQLAIDTVLKVAPNEDPRVTTVGADSLRIQTSTLENAQVEEVKGALAEAYNVPASNVTSSFIGPSWGKDISQKAIIGIVVFLLLVTVVMSIYFRNWRMALAALLALFHDLIITVGIYAAVGWEVTPATVIGFLTILGFSLYDTVVVFDKVRENQKVLTATGRSTYGEMVNKSLNAVLMRSISTSFVALMPVLSLLIVGAGVFGATSLEDFALALAAGLFIGSYSSIFVAAPILAWWKGREPQYVALAERRRRASASASASAAAPSPVPQMAVGAEDDLVASPLAPVGVPGPPAVGRSIQPRPRQQRGRKRK